jgi:hypothetical protein
MVANDREVQTAGNANWRFLPGLPVGGALLAIGTTPVGLESVFSSVATLPATGDLTTSFAADSGPYNLISCPDSVLPVPSYRRLRHLLYDQGALFMCWQSQLPDWLGRPLRVRRALRQAGFGSITLYGALPGGQLSTFFYPMVGHAISFVLKQYIQGHSRRHLYLRMMRPGWLHLVRWVQPGYAVIAHAT